jgi:hypothetical protein
VGGTNMAMARYVLTLSFNPHAVAKSGPSPTPPVRGPKR